MVSELLTGHHAFRRQWLADDRAFLRRLATEGQKPEALFIGCSDARVVPDLITGSAPGQLFVVRNIANLVPPFAQANISVGAAIEFAVTQLKVPHVVVCGHYGCGGVQAVLEGKSLDGLPSLREWLRGVEPAVAMANAADPAADPTARWRLAVEENAALQLENLVTFPVVRAAVERGELELHAWVYDLYTLELRVYDVGSDRFVPASELLAEAPASV